MTTRRVQTYMSTSRFGSMAQCRNNHSREFQNTHSARWSWIARLGASVPHFQGFTLTPYIANWAPNIAPAVRRLNELRNLFTIDYAG
jgi:hypothetical protein